MAAKRGRYERLVTTDGGRRWLAAHPEAAEANTLVRIAQALEHDLCNKALPDARRKALTAEVRRMLATALLGTDQPSAAKRREVMVGALDMACGTLVMHQEQRGTTWPPGARNVARSILALGLGAAKVTDDVLDAAIRVWPKRHAHLRSQHLHALAKALGCALANAEATRVELSKVRRPKS